MREPDPSLTASEAKVLADVIEYGVHVVHVLEDESGPGFSYTVGLWHSFGQPEVLVFGLGDEIAHELLNLVADEASDGDKCTHGTRHEGLLEGYPVQFLGIESSEHARYLGLAQWAYEGEEFPVVQLVYPDRMGRWPWDPATKKGFRECQPVVGRRDPSA